MGGDFPTLAYSCQKGVDVTSRSPFGAVKARSKSGAWGKRRDIVPSTIVESSDAYSSDLDRTNIASTAVMSDTSSMSSVDPPTMQAALKKKGKTKIVLMSNSR